MADDHYKQILDDILENLVELVPIAGDHTASVANCQDGLQDLLDIRKVLNVHIRATRKELQRRKLAGNPLGDKPLPKTIEEFLRSLPKTKG